jgi:hypothetical protein
MVQEIYDRSWRFGQVDPFRTPVPLGRLLRVVDEDPDVRLAAVPDSELEGGAYDGGHVIAVATRDTPLYYMVPAEAVPLLEPYLGPEEYQDLLRRTPKLHSGAG